MLRRQRKRASERERSSTHSIHQLVLLGDLNKSVLGRGGVAEQVRLQTERERDFLGSGESNYNKASAHSLGGGLSLLPVRKDNDSVQVDGV